MRQLGVSSVADGGPSRGRSLHASPLGSPRAGKAGEFMPMRLTERQQLALALEESLKASQPQPQSSPSKNNTGSGESSATRVRNGASQPAQLRRSSSEAAKRSSEKANTSQAPVQRTFSAGSDTESSAGPSGRPEPSFSPRRDTVEANTFGEPDKDGSFSDTSRHSHSTSLPSTPRGQGQGQRVATDSADSASPCASPAHSQGPCKAAPAEDEEDKSQRSSAGAFTDVQDTSLQPGTEKVLAEQADLKPVSVELVLEERPGSADASKGTSSAPSSQKRGLDVIVKEEPSGSKKRRTLEDGTPSVAHKPEVKEEPCLDPVTPGKSKRDSQQPGTADSPSDTVRDASDACNLDQPPHHSADVRTPPLSTAKPRAPSPSPEGGGSGSEEGKRDPASTDYAPTPAPRKLIVRKPGSTKPGSTKLGGAKSGSTPRRSGRVAALDSEPASPIAVASPSAAAATASTAPFGRAQPQPRASLAARKLRSQEPAPEVMDPFARPPVPTKKGSRDAAARVASGDLGHQRSSDQQRVKGDLATAGASMRIEAEMGHLGGPAPTSPFAGWPVPAHLERQPSAVLSENLLQVSKSLDALHERGSFMSACSKLHRSSTSGGLQMQASLPPLFRGSSNVHRLQSAYEDMLQRQALEREAVDGVAGYLCPPQALEGSDS
ncbi:hypothetical protein WJX73_008122 [Symbiochloris irregularis]|uniref:Uncharacterized protein n=1 Tax=Symbiochloris irregularis TaxID=706552 RepID=A0AAW1PW34_9CHLO